MKIEINKSWIGIDVIIPTRHYDDRGFFSELYKYNTYFENNITSKFVQENHSFSLQSGTLRGLHFQAPPFSQAKLIRCGQGSIYDVAVDIRLGSPYYGKWFGYKLTAENGHQLFVPDGFAHGFITLETNSEIIYKCSEYYDPKSEGALFWNDPDN